MDPAELRQQRGLARASFTRASKALRIALAEEDDTKIKELSSQIKDTYHALVAANELCDKEDDYATYLDEVQDTYVDALNNIKGRKTSLSAPPKTPINELPRVELPVFNGDPTAYPLFMKIFDELVDAANITDSSKLTRLLQFTAGAPHEAIKSCVYSKDGYASARVVLKERFGDKYLITDRIISGLRYGKPVRSPDELMQLADELRSCVKSLDDLGTKSEVETQEFIVCVTKRLPADIQIAWKRRAVSIKWQKGNYPTFVDFADYIKEEAKISSDPVYGAVGVKLDQRSVVNHAASSSVDSPSACKHAGNASHARGSGNESDSGGSRNNGGRSESYISRWTCMLCNQSHKLFYCKHFRSMSVDERLNFVNSHELCNVLLAAISTLIITDSVHYVFLVM